VLIPEDKDVVLNSKDMTKLAQAKGSE